MWKNDLTNISAGSYKKQFQTGTKVCSVIVEDAMYGDYKGGRELLDKTVVDDMCKAVVKALAGNCSKYNEMPSVVTISHDSEEFKQSQEEILQSKDANIYDIKEAEETLDEVALSDADKEQIDVILSAIQNHNILIEKWGLTGHGLDNRAVILNFYGLPGTGKSMTARAVANHLGRKVLQVNYSELESKYVGETPKNIKRVFKEAKENNAVIIFDEADSFLSKRLTNITQAADYGVNITRSVMLMELEQFDGVVIFTTNLISNYDRAFKRRILASVKFDLPDVDAREKIWRIHIGEKMPLKDVSAVQLAEKFENITGADIKDIVYYAALIALQNNKEYVEMDDFSKAYGYVIKRYNTEERE